MRSDPDGTVRAVIERVVRRTWIAHIAHAGATASLATAVALVALWGASRPILTPVAVAIALSAAAIVLSAGRAVRTSAAAADRIERARPECRNVIITARELLSYPDRASSWMRERVLREAAAQAVTIDPARVVPLTRPLALLAGGACLCAMAIVGIPQKAVSALRALPGRAPEARTADGEGRLRIVARLQPPAYTGIPPREIADPGRLDVVAGTHVRLAVSGSAPRWRIRFGSTPVTTTVDGTTTVAEMVLSESGYFAIEAAEAAMPSAATPSSAPRSAAMPSSATRSAANRTLLAVAVSHDRAPLVRIDTPGRDLLLPDATSRIPIAASASDDFGLQAFDLRYTKVSGTGEQFEFQEGVLPLAITPQSPREWKARAEIALASLRLEAGDSLVYRAVARDARPGDAGIASSDTFFIEVAGPGQVALAGFDMPVERERHALSQQMIVLKIQRLRAREPGLSRGAVAEEASAIAAEQRAVRSNFIFLMGGHVEDEEAEAEQSSDIQEGRLQNSAHKEITAAITFMGRAEQALTAVNTGAALPPARSAVEALQRAFGRNRYILRTLPVRSRVDPSRRLTGELSGAGDWRRDVLPPVPDRQTREARVMLSRLLDGAATLQAGGVLDPAVLAALSEEALAVEPTSPEWQLVSARLAAARNARGPREAARLLGEALGPVIARAQQGARLARTEATRPPGALLSAWTEGSRR